MESATLVHEQVQSSCGAFKETEGVAFPLLTAQLGQSSFTYTRSPSLEQVPTQLSDLLTFQKYFYYNIKHRYRKPHKSNYGLMHYYKMHPAWAKESRTLSQHPSCLYKHFMLCLDHFQVFILTALLPTYASQDSV